MNKKNNNKILVTGGAGFLGGYLVNLLLKNGETDIVIYDRLQSHEPQQNTKYVTYVKGDILNAEHIADVFTRFGPFETVYHLAAAMPNKAHSDEKTIEINVTGTNNVVSNAVKNGVKSFVFTSSNVIYGIPESLPVTEKTIPLPLESYGKSKLEAESILAHYEKDITIQIFRCPVITGVGRLGLQSILYEFISENKNVYILGDGSNVYQFADAGDVAEALVKSSRRKGFDIYNIGGDGYMPLRALYEQVIAFAGSTSTIVTLPKMPAVWTLTILDKLNISPLGIYQYTMMSKSLYADTSKIKRNLRWRPKKTNLDSFIENYQWYLKNKITFKELGKSELSANRSLPKMGIFRLLKTLS